MFWTKLLMEKVFNMIWQVVPQWRGSRSKWSFTAVLWLWCCSLQSSNTNLPEENVGVPSRTTFKASCTDFVYWTIIFFQVSRYQRVINVFFFMTSWQKLLVDYIFLSAFFQVQYWTLNKNSASHKTFNGNLIGIDFYYDSKLY